MIVELTIYLKDEDDPYRGQIAQIVADVDKAVGDHVDSGVSFMEPRCREVGWEAVDQNQADFFIQSINSRLDRMDPVLSTKVCIRPEVSHP
jgi:hypothetical protein